MKTDKNDSPDKPAGDVQAARQLAEVRLALLHLHKTFVESERETYEQTVGTISSPNHFLQLLMSDPWFVWLQPLSQLIVAMDEALDEKEPLTAARVEALMSQARGLLVASETGDGFSKHYFDALQRDPDVVLAHAVVVRAAKKSDKPQGSVGNNDVKS